VHRIAHAMAVINADSFDHSYSLIVTTSYDLASSKPTWRESALNVVSQNESNSDTTKSSNSTDVSLMVPSSKNARSAVGTDNVDLPLTRRVTLSEVTSSHYVVGVSLTGQRLQSSAKFDLQPDTSMDEKCEPSAIMTSSSRSALIEDSAKTSAIFACVICVALGIVVSIIAVTKFVR